MNLKMRLKQAQARKQLGFTLIEVMVALMVVAIALTALSKSLGQFVFQQGELEQRVVASWVAQNRIVALQAGQVESQEKTQTVTLLQAQWRSEVAFEPTLVPMVKKMQMSVYLGDEVEPSATLTTVVAE